MPASIVALVAGFWVTRRLPRTDRTRAALLLWGGWLLVTGVVLSYMKGIVHPYYTVALAPAIGAVVAIGARRALDPPRAVQLPALARRARRRCRRLECGTALA